MSEIQTESGLVVPHDKLVIGGVFDVFINGELVESIPNLVTNEGLDYMLNAGLTGGTQVSSWYVTAYKGAVAPASTWTAANFDTNATEVLVSDVAEATRQAWSQAGVSGQQVDNYASKAELTVDVATLDLNGVAIVSASAFGATSGTLLAATQFTATRSLLQNDVIGLGYRFSAATS